jgi:hypothetical protein
MFVLECALEVQPRLVTPTHRLRIASVPSTFYVNEGVGHRPGRNRVRQGKSVRDARSVCGSVAGLNPACMTVVAPALKVKAAEVARRGSALSVTAIWARPQDGALWSNRRVPRQPERCFVDPGRFAV